MATKRTGATRLGSVVGALALLGAVLWTAESLRDVALDSESPSLAQMGTDDFSGHERDIYEIDDLDDLDDLDDVSDTWGGIDGLLDWHAIESERLGIDVDGATVRVYGIDDTEGIFVVGAGSEVVEVRTEDDALSFSTEERDDVWQDQDGDSDLTLRDVPANITAPGFHWVMGDSVTYFGADGSTATSAWHKLVLGPASEIAVYGDQSEGEGARKNVNDRDTWSYVHLLSTTPVDGELDFISVRSTPAGDAKSFATSLAAPSSARSVEDDHGHTGAQVDGALSLSVNASVIPLNGTLVRHREPTTDWKSKFTSGVAAHSLEDQPTYDIADLTLLQMNQDRAPRYVNTATIRFD